MRHLCMPKHVDKWIASTESPPSREDLMQSLSSKWRPSGEGGYVGKRTQVKEAKQKRADKLQRTAAVAALTRVIARTTEGDGALPMGAMPQQPPGE